MSRRLSALLLFLFLPSGVLIAGNLSRPPVTGHLETGLTFAYAASEISYRVEVSTYRYDFRTSSWDLSRRETAVSDIETGVSLSGGALYLSKLVAPRTSVTLSARPAECAVDIGGTAYKSSGRPIRYGLGARYFLTEDFPLTPAFSFYARIFLSSFQLEANGREPAGLDLAELYFGTDICRRTGAYFYGGGLGVLLQSGTLFSGGTSHYGRGAAGGASLYCGRSFGDDFYFFLGANVYNKTGFYLTVTKDFEL